MQNHRKRNFLVLAGLVGLLSVGGYLGWKKYTYPFGYKGCSLLCLSETLHIYASDHDGKFPTSDEGPLEALRKLYPKYTTEFYLAGLSGNVEKLKDALDKALPLDTNLSSVVYVQGLDTNSNGDIAILWDRTPGIWMNGRRIEKSSHFVVFKDGFGKIIHGEKWEEFMVQQERLRKLP